MHGLSKGSERRAIKVSGAGSHTHTHTHLRIEDLQRFLVLPLRRGGVGGGRGGWVREIDMNNAVT